MQTSSTNAALAPWLDQLARSPDVYPQKLDSAHELALLVRTQESAYRAASFLDDRFLTGNPDGIWAPVAALKAASERIDCGRPLHFIFHTGHVGSTLVSRLLDDLAPILSLREPLPLRTLADLCDATPGDFEPSAALFARLWSRGYAHTRAVVLKATSSAGRIAAPLLQLLPTARAIYLNLGAEPYLATLLAGENSMRDLQAYAAARERRLRAYLAAVSGLPAITSAGELAAMSWLVESWSQRVAQQKLPERVLAVDFAEFLRDVRQGLAQIADHLGLQADPVALRDINRSALLARYSKAQDHAYTAETRSEILRASRQHNAVEIARGLAWLDALARNDAGAGAIVAAAIR